MAPRTDSANASPAPLKKAQQLGRGIIADAQAYRESFNDIYLDLSKEPGRCRAAESGLGWKPHNGETWTLDKAEIVNAQWSRAARGHELKIFARNVGVVQLDGFKQDVSEVGSTRRDEI